MAMNQAEKARMHMLETMLKRCYTLYPQLQPVYPDVLPPIVGSTALSRGWILQDSPLRILEAFSSHAMHGFGKGNTPTYYGAKELYSTRELAITAYKHKRFMELSQRLITISEDF